jgi:hypothetical protein
MKRFLSPALCAVALSVPLNPAPSRAAVVISEILYNEVGSDTAGEWLEIFNNGGAAVDLTNWKIGDEEASGGTGATEAMFAFPAGTVIAPGEVMVIAVDADRFLTVYGFLPDFELFGSAANNLLVPDLTVYGAWDPDGGLINMSNSNDQALLLNPSDAAADAASWGNTFAFNPALSGGTPDGQSYYRLDPYSDTDTAADWALTPGGGSTPGIIPEPATALTAAGAAATLLLRRRRH